MGKRFVEGKGWIVDEGGDAEKSPAAGKAPVKALPVNKKPTAGLTREDLDQVAAQMGLTVIPSADLAKMVARIGELERFLDHANEKLEELQGEGAGIVTPPAQDGKELTREELKKAIEEAPDLDALTALMKDVKDKTALKLADARAEELKGAGK